LPITGTSAWSGAGPHSGPIAPVGAADGGAFVVGEAGSAVAVYRIDPRGAVVDGWPHLGPTAMQWEGTCPAGSAGCGVWRSQPTLSEDGDLYLPLAAPDAQIGATLAAVGPDGRDLAGWPMHLARRGAEWWTSAVAADGTAFGLAVEPEAGGSTSATIVAIAKDGSVRSRTTVVAP
jgi:hypothetical protein